MNQSHGRQVPLNLAELIHRDTGPDGLPRRIW